MRNKKKKLKSSITKIHTESLAIMAGAFCLENMLTLSPGYKFRR